ncbi:MAG: hypothetical protein RLZZ86_1411 [Cyanobacteriota bacterium]
MLPGKVISYCDYVEVFLGFYCKICSCYADVGFYEFRRQLEYKTQLYGNKLIVADFVLIINSLALF